MSKFVFEYTPDKEQRLDETIEANNITEAYITFVKTHPREHIIIDYIIDNEENNTL